MTGPAPGPGSYVFGGYEYPPDHWAELWRFAVGDEKDPKGLFRLAADRWVAWQYAEDGRPSDGEKFTFRFRHLRSWIRLYVKRYCYLFLTRTGVPLRTWAAVLPYRLAPADKHITEQGYLSLESIREPEVFEGVWASLLRPGGEGGQGGGEDLELLPRSAVLLQEITKSFWLDLSQRFGAPSLVPPPAPHRRQPVRAWAGSDTSRVIPTAVCRQLTNRLALHRDGVASLGPLDHLRLCVLMLLICVGRRVDEVLSARRGEGVDGPLEWYPCRPAVGEAQAKALWFRFRPNKDGPSDVVYISPAWESLGDYCVRELLRYGDAVRRDASPTDQKLLILVSTTNGTRGFGAGGGLRQPASDGAPGGPRAQKVITTPLMYENFRRWLNGKKNSRNPGRSAVGVMERWNVTADGSADGPVYRFPTHAARHSRQTALSLCTHIPLLVRQRDLNHSDPDMQFVYQHTVEEENRVLLAKVGEAPVHGRAMAWFRELLGLDAGGDEADRGDGFTQGPVTLMTPRLRKLVESNPQYFEADIGDTGLCVEPRGHRKCSPRRRTNGRGRPAVVGKEVPKPPPAIEPGAEMAGGMGEPKRYDPPGPGAEDARSVIRMLEERRRQIEEGGL